MCFLSIMFGRAPKCQKTFIKVTRVLNKASQYKYFQLFKSTLVDTLAFTNGLGYSH